MNEAKNYVVRILSDEYIVQSDEPKEFIDRAGSLVNTYIQDILEKNKHIDHKKATVLVALRLASQMVHLEQLINSIALKEKELVTAIDKVCC